MSIIIMQVYFMPESIIEIASFKSLEKAIDAGMYDLAGWERNSRLKILHEDPKWQELKSKIQFLMDKVMKKN
ncbi:hypothetical protein Murru_0542 [Allomuricauda ruestringensis DSM 13258]|uniref:Uncharacterized protein n=1 Tax=Allomuricauda ruestringensis (strain DSM 13258 / CIP 107369 / LMG 19739 / B1) TaxID=886377 RepID=G2PS03_ALLRU|nr:hypothetical protein [Allomuricauda ruestringensis]AEM69593.1 hypothetical protein Murru_0542 [Allomuricauda ruestringensis DSM 13258]